MPLCARLSHLFSLWRMILAVVALQCGGAPVSAADLPPSVPGMREARIAPESFVRAAPLPPWVQRQAVPPTQRKDPVVLRLRDAQVRIDPSLTVFAERAIQVNQAIALDQIGQFSLEYQPQYQRLNLHAVRLLRGDTVLDRTASADVRMLERESGFERGVYLGTVTVAIVIPDVRVGDTLDIAYVIEGSNPVFNGRYFDDFGWDSPVPTELRQVRVSHPQDRMLHWRMLGDHRSGQVEPRIERTGGMQTLHFEERAIDGVADEPLVPNDYFKWRRLQVSEYKDWNEVARWGEALFPAVDTAPGELQALLDRLRALPTAAERVAEATRWVQGEVRNFSLSLGESSHRPHPPGFVLEKRFGDCKDKAYLLLTLLRQLGIEATPLLVSMQAPRAPAKVLPSPWPFDHVVLQARVDGATVILDATSPAQTAALSSMAQPPHWVVGLLASAQTTAPGPLANGPTREPTTLDVEETVRFDQLGAAGTLQVRKVMNQGAAEILRLLWATMPPEQRRQLALEDYEKRFPGIELSAGPEAIDDLVRNRFGFTASYRIPQLARPLDGGWAVPIVTTALRGLINMPPSLQRRFPLQATDFPMTRRHLLTVHWPAQVSASIDPSTQSMDGKLFRAEARTSFRGARYEFLLQVQTKQPDLAAADLPLMQDDLRRLDDLIPGRVVVSRQMIGNAGTTGPDSAANAMRRRMQERIDGATGAIRSGLPKGDELAKVHCRRALALAYTERFAEALADTDEALRIAPDLSDAWECRGEVLYFSGDFDGADKALSRGMALPDATETGDRYIRGMARAFLGRHSEAAADFERAAAAGSDGESRLYALMWQMWALQRAGLPLPADLLAAARQDPGGAWPRPAMAMLAGDLTPQAMLADIDRLQGDERTLALAEAWFYIGQWHLVHGRKDAARDAFRQCRAQGITSYYEHVAAGFELARLP